MGDAGDWDSYETNPRVAQELLLVYSMAAGHFKDGELNIPESGKRVADILDEAAWLDPFVPSPAVLAIAAFRLCQSGGHFQDFDFLQPATVCSNSQVRMRFVTRRLLPLHPEFAQIPQHYRLDPETSNVDSLIELEHKSFRLKST